MMDFITIPLVVGMITLGIYKLFDLFVRKKERLAIIEKIGDKFDSSMIENKFSFPFNFKFENVGTFGALKVACLLIGVGLGLLIGFFICNEFVYGHVRWIRDFEEIAGIIYGASTLLFGGLGLLIAFLIEMKYRKNKKEE